MRAEATDSLLLPGSGRPPELTAFFSSGDHVLEGVLRASNEWYPIRGGVPCFLRGTMRPDLSAFQFKHNLPSAAPPKPDAASEMSTEVFFHRTDRFKKYGFARKQRQALLGEI